MTGKLPFRHARNPVAPMPTKMLDERESDRVGAAGFAETTRLFFHDHAKERKRHELD